MTATNAALAAAIILIPDSDRMPPPTTREDDLGGGRRALTVSWKRGSRMLMVIAKGGAFAVCRQVGLHRLPWRWHEPERAAGAIRDASKWFLEDEIEGAL